MKTQTNRRHRQAGFVVTFELLLISAILVIGLVVGLIAVRDATVVELADLSEAIGAIEQTYTYNGVTTAAGTASTQGSAFQDQVDDGILTVDTVSGDGVDDFVFAPGGDENP